MSIRISFILVPAALLIYGCNPSSPPSQSPQAEVLSAADPSADFSEGKALFDRHCSKCHGPEASGSPTGPPLVHKIYEPGHHVDISFQRAVQFGVRAHHWPFGDMPPVPGVTPEEADRIIAYIRSLQRRAGIF